MKTIILCLLLFISVNAQSDLLILMGDDGYVPANFEVQDYSDAMTTALSNEQLERLDILVTMLKDSLSVDSLSDKFDVLYVLANETSEAGLRNLVKRSHDAQIVSTVTFAAFEGFTGDGIGGYINTNYTPSTQGLRYTQDSASVFIYSRSNLTEQKIIVGGNNGSNAYHLYLIPYMTATGVLSARMHANTAYGSVTGNSNTLGLYTLSRISSTSLRYYRNATSNLSFNASTAVSIPSVPIAILANKLTTAGCDNFSTYQISFMGMGASLSATEVRQINNCIEFYMDDLGKGVE